MDSIFASLSSGAVFKKRKADALGGSKHTAAAEAHTTKADRGKEKGAGASRATGALDLFGVAATPTRTSTSTCQAAVPVRDAAEESESESESESEAEAEAEEAGAGAGAGESEEEVRALRNRLSIKVRGRNPLPPPATRFADMRLYAEDGSGSGCESMRDVILRNIEGGEGAGNLWREPTAVQMQAVPALLAGRDVLAIAPTGSGKTGAFVLPLLSMVAEAKHRDAQLAQTQTQAQGRGRKKSKKGEVADAAGTASVAAMTGGIRALVLVPTRELADQIHREISRLSAGRRINVCSLNQVTIKAAAASQASGGGDPFRRFDVLVTTPMRLLSFLGGGSGGGDSGGLRVDLSAVRLVVLDEVDKLFEHETNGGGRSRSRDKNTGKLGEGEDGEEEENVEEAVGFSSSFLTQVDCILAACPGADTSLVCVKALFSATINPFVQQLAAGFLSDPVSVSVGTLNAGASAIKQSLSFVGNEQGKLLGLRQLVTEGRLRPPVLLFVQSVERAKALHAELAFDGINVDVIHADRSAAQREDVIARFRSGTVWVLICTDLMARGIDFKHVKMVINYDLPSSPTAYIHRIGRTGRAGRSGEAVTFFTEADITQLRSIANVMRLSGCEVPDWMLAIKQLSTKEKRSLRNHGTQRRDISTTPRFDQRQQERRRSMISKSRDKKDKKGGHGQEQR